MNNWPTKQEDMKAAQQIMESFWQNTNKLGLLEISVDIINKQMDYELSPWVLILARYFTNLYGNKQGQFVTRKVISKCIVGTRTIH